jgi:hypothetical protein
MFRAIVPVLPSVFDAVAAYKAGAMSGKQAAKHALKEIAEDIALMVIMCGFVKCGKAAVKSGVKSGVKMVAKGFKGSSGVATSQIKKWGLNVAEEKFKINWKQPDIMARGLEYESAVVKELEATGLTKLPPNTNTFDMYNFETQHALSIKSLNTQTPARLADPRQIEYLMNSYGKDVKEFKGISKGLIPIEPSEIKLPEIRIGVPKETTLDQWLTMQRSAINAERQGIKITFGIEK